MDVFPSTVGEENTVLDGNCVSLSDLGKRDLSELCGAVTWSVTILPYFCHFSDYGCYFCDQSSRLLQHSQLQCQSLRVARFFYCAEADLFSFTFLVLHWMLGYFCFVFMTVPLSLN